MDALARRIAERLKSRNSCTLFENDIDGLWPRNKKVQLQRERQIQAFAKARGWSATILDPGIRVTFRQGDKAK